MNIQSYTVLHYGADYLPYALRSVYDRMDLLHVCYSPHPSHGHTTNTLPPEERCDLLQAATSYKMHDKISWSEVHHIWQEGQHRDWALSLCVAAGAELVLVIDADEVWPDDTLDQVIAHVWQANAARNWLINFTTLWRSFDYVVRDDLWPVRLIDLRHSDGTAYVPRELGPIYHFGYAIRDSIMRYKWQCHGHKSELRSNWLEDKWEAWPPPPDCHPTNGDGFWNPEPFNKARLPEIMREHPFWGLEKIE